MSLSKTNFYKGLLACVCLQALCSTAHADASLKPYVGVGVGYSVIDFKNNHAEINGTTTTRNSTSANAKGAVESLFVGVQKHIQNMAFGGELYGYLSQQKAKERYRLSTTAGGDSVGDSRVETMQRKYGYGVRVKGGYFVNPTALAYVHAGVENARFQYAGVTNFSNARGWQPYKKNKSLIGLPFGAGLEVDVTSLWKTRLEYTYTKYKALKTGDMLGADFASSKITPRQHTVVLGVSYQI